MAHTESIALVTGGSGEIGSEISLALARSGHSVAVHFHKDAEGADRVVRMIISRGGQAWSFRADLTEVRAAENLIERVSDRYGTIDVLVNNAGIAHKALLLDTSDDDIERVLAINLKSAVLVTRAAVPHMLVAGRGSIINVSSIAATKPMRGNSIYVAAKAGIEGFTKAMAAELGRKGIRVNAIAPGIIESEMTRLLASRSEGQLLKQIALERLGQAQDVGDAVCYLASDNASYITGQVIHVDGGTSHLVIQ